MNSLLLAVRFLLLFFLFSHRTTGTFGDIISEAISTEPETLESYKQTAGVVHSSLCVVQFQNNSTSLHPEYLVRIVPYSET